MKMDVAVGGGGTSVGLADLLIVLASGGGGGEPPQAWRICSQSWRPPLPPAPSARPLAYSLGTGNRPPSKTCQKYPSTHQQIVLVIQKEELNTFKQTKQVIIKSVVKIKLKRKKNNLLIQIIIFFIEYPDPVKEARILKTAMSNAILYFTVHFNPPPQGEKYC